MAVRESFVRLKAVLWLHTLRLWRYRYSFLNMILSEAAWIFMFVLGALLFVPSERLGVAVKGAFWTIVAWSFVSNFSSLVGGWMNFFISIGMVEEHLVRGFSPFRTLLGRVVTGLSVVVASLLFMAALVGGAFHVDLLRTERLWLLLAGMGLLAVQSLSYGFTVASIAVRTSVPNNLLDILDGVVIGLLMVPVQALPEALRLIFLCIPYVAPAHLVKLATGAGEGLEYSALAIAGVEALVMAVVAAWATKWAIRWIRRNGVRAIGFW
ncbi:MAG: hypothetical protein QI223_05885 [Candidatus Korarchaeota archaeon]|nr:hypothetical protein [Candidatus Korarchaeota archaeon]